MLKFKSFQDKNTTKCKDIHGMFTDKYYTITDWATEQLERFIAENHITDSRIKDIKFTVDGEGTEHVLLIYEEIEEV